MIKHIVLMKLHDEAGGRSKDENLAILRSALMELPDKIDIILDYEVGLNVTVSPHAYDLVLYSTFLSADELDEYRNHPEHQKVFELISLVVRDKAFVDYEYSEL